MPGHAPTNTGPGDRSSWMSLLACTPPARLAEHWRGLGLNPDFVWLREPEIGCVMVRGRAGGSGLPFNLGEMTVTRCALRLTAADVSGHAYVQGRDRGHAQRAALIDALMQTHEASRLWRDLLQPLEAARARDRADETARAEATRVDFFTLARGEDKG